MIVYSVTIEIEAAVESDWLDWVKGGHVPDVIRTGCFSDCHIHKVIGSEPANPTYVLQYRCLSIEQYHRYRDNFAPALQKDHRGRFAGHFRASRQLLEEIEHARPDGISTKSANPAARRGDASR